MELELIFKLIEFIPWLDVAMVTIVFGVIQLVKTVLPEVNKRTITIVVGLLAAVFVFFKFDLAWLEFIAKAFAYVVGTAGTYGLFLKPMLKSKTD